METTKICENCGRQYFDEKNSASPPEALGRIFLEALQNRKPQNLCPDCREELGILSLLGFGE
ncbi:MAG: hypothetical protein JXA41_13570 [Deltaproteobacteria bacterium]|nr:hypothetical protein [Deltaproteobacteria bacterium]